MVPELPCLAAFVCRKRGRWQVHFAHPHTTPMHLGWGCYRQGLSDRPLYLSHLSWVFYSVDTMPPTIIVTARIMMITILFHGYAFYVFILLNCSIVYSLLQWCVCIVIVVYYLFFPCCIGGMHLIQLNYPFLYYCIIDWLLFLVHYFWCVVYVHLH